MDSLFGTGLLADMAVVWLALGGWMLVLVVVADVAGIRAKHAPGTAVEGGHDVFLFRASRALANTNETLGVFMLFSLACVALRADPQWSMGMAWVYLGGRVGHGVCYWLDQRLARSVFFGLALAAAAGLGVTAAIALFQ